MQNLKLLSAFILILVLISLWQNNVLNFSVRKDMQPTKTPVKNLPSTVPSKAISPTIINKKDLFLTSTPVPTGVRSDQDSAWSGINDFIYPNSKVILQTQNSLELESLDDPAVITDWYKVKIEALKMSAKSFVKTNANGNILNKLDAASSNREIRVDIEKKNSGQAVTIKIIFVNSN